MALMLRSTSRGPPLISPTHTCEGERVIQPHWADVERTPRVQGCPGAPWGCQVERDASGKWAVDVRRSGTDGSPWLDAGAASVGTPLPDELNNGIASAIASFRETETSRDVSSPRQLAKRAILIMLGKRRCGCDAWFRSCWQKPWI